MMQEPESKLVIQQTNFKTTKCFALPGKAFRRFEESLRCGKKFIGIVDQRNRFHLSILIE